MTLQQNVNVSSQSSAEETAVNRTKDLIQAFITDIRSSLAKMDKELHIELVRSSSAK